MKKFLILVTSSILCFTLVACSNQETEVAATASNMETAEEATDVKEADVSSETTDTTTTENTPAQDTTTEAAATDDASQSNQDSSTAESAEIQVGELTVERQLDIFAQQRSVWAVEPEFTVDGQYCTVLDFNRDGKLVLMVAEFGGTGHDTYSRFFHIDEKGTVQELSTPFTEEQSEPDLVGDGEIECYKSTSGEYYYVVTDLSKESPISYVHETGALSYTGNGISYTTLATSQEQYTAEDVDPTVICKDAAGNELTKEEYCAIGEKYFTDLGYTEESVAMFWSTVSEIKPMDHAAAVQALQSCLN